MSVGRIKAYAFPRLEWTHGTKLEGAMDCHAMRAAFAEAMRAFVEHRRAHGGILLPDLQIVLREFDEALYETGLRERPKPAYEQVGSLLMPTSGRLEPGEPRA